LQNFTWKKEEDFKKLCKILLFLRLERNTEMAKTNIKLVKDDVSRFVNNVENLDVWSNDYFLKLADRIRLV